MEGQWQRGENAINQTIHATVEMEKLVTLLGNVGNQL